MALGRSIKMYLTIFVATTCVYMVLYQYHVSISRESIPSQETSKSKNILAESLTNAENAKIGTASLIKRYNNIFLASSSLSSISSSSISLPSSFNTATPASSSTLLSPTAIPHPQLTSVFSSSSTLSSTTIESMLVPKKVTVTLKVKKPSAQLTVAPLGYISSDKANNKPPLYIITPTYKRPEQLAELVRMGYTLKHVENLFWLVIEDANVTSPLVYKTLNRIGVPYEYLLAPMPEKFKTKKGAKPRGVSNRNRGVQWLREHALEGAFYFADDDNTYDISIFEQIRYTKKVSMWPVGLVTKLGISSPIVKNGKLIGFYDWIGGRRYPVDMAGFAVGVKFLLERPNAKMPFNPGYEEDGFIKSLEPFNLTEIELLASGCTEVLVWHTQSKKNPSAVVLNMTRYANTNLVSTDQHLVRKIN